jgi:hypothetical protein
LCNNNLKTNKQNIGIRDLFRNKLEYAGIVPDASVGSILMRRLARKEFLRFNPARFNIYYLGVAIIAGVTAGIILFSNADSTKKSTSETVGNKTNELVNSDYLNIPAGQVINRAPEKRNNDHLRKITSDTDKGFETAKLKDAGNSAGQRNIPVSVPARVNDSISIKNLFTGTSRTAKKIQTVNNNDQVLFDLSAMRGCTPLKIHFYNKVVSLDSCLWTFGDGGYSRQKNPDWIFDVEGDYKVVLQVFGPNKMYSTSTATITVYPKPKARFEISPEKPVLPDDEIRFINYSNDGVNFRWDFGDGSKSELTEPRHKYARFGNYNIRMTAISEYGCMDSIEVVNAFSGSEYFIDFPNAFVPNPGGPSGGAYSSKSDEGAQVFHPVFSGVSDYELKIFSKLGILIFESHDINIGWDGYFKGQLNNPGVYIWKVRGNFRNGQQFTKMGDVTLLKNL